MNNLTTSAYRTSLTLILVVALAWLTVGIVREALRNGRGGPLRRVPVPRFARYLVISVTSMVATAKPAHATPGDTSRGIVADRDDAETSTESLLLAGSLAANGLFCAVHVRRALVRMRTRRFGSSETKHTAEKSTAPMRIVGGPDWRVIVRVLGPPTVETRCGQRIEFSKGKARELLVWMSEHRETSTRSAARTALWEGAVQDATFSNVVSDVRRTLNSIVPLVDDEWIPRTFTDELPLSSAVITDAQILDGLIDGFVNDQDLYLDELKTAIAQVRNLPFSGANYSWADGEGITTSHVIKVVKAAVLLAEYAIECDDTELLFMATERGLRVLPGHEELVSLRMRGHARTGNRSAIKLEWESYARAIEADSWAGAAPSRELELLACELSKS